VTLRSSYHIARGQHSRGIQAFARGFGLLQVRRIFWIAGHVQLGGDAE
jgi:hypothetical protein